MRYNENKSTGPHGGFPETIVKFVAFGIVIGAVGAALRDWGRREDVRPLHSEEVAGIAEAHQIAESFLAKGGGWSEEEVVAARNRIVALRIQHQVTTRGGKLFDREVMKVVDTAQDERKTALRLAKNPLTRMRYAQWAIDLDRALMERVIAEQIMKNPLRERRNDAEIVGAGKFLAKCYLFLIPAMMLIFLFRIKRAGWSVSEEILLGAPQFLLSSVLWPLGLACYPEGSAVRMRRKAVAREYLARMPAGHQLTATDEAAIDEIARASVREMLSRLGAMRKVSAAFALRARVALYTTVFMGMLLAPFSSARAQSGSGGGIGVERPPAVELHGFLQAAGGVPAGVVPFGLQHLQFMAAMRPTDGVQIDVIHRPSANRLLDASVTVHPAGSDFDVRIGQMTPRLGYLSPPPHKEPIIGGPGAAANLEFLDVGVELHGSHGVLEESLAVVSGSGGNQPDQNHDKDVIATVSVRPFGGLLFELAFQTGIEPEDGRVTRGAAHAAYQHGGFALDGLGTVLRVGDDTSSAASASAAYRTGAVRFSAGWDGMWLSGTQPDHIGRAQVSVYPLNGDDHLQVSAMGRMSREHGTSGTVQVQAGF